MMKYEVKYEVGDKVIIKTWEELEQEFEVHQNLWIEPFDDKDAFTEEMDELLNKNYTNRVLTIEEVMIGGSYYMKEDDEGWTWENYMIKGLKEDNTVHNFVDRFELMDFDDG